MIKISQIKKVEGGTKFVPGWYNLPNVWNMQKALSSVPNIIKEREGGLEGGRRERRRERRRRERRKKEGRREGRKEGGR